MVHTREAEEDTLQVLQEAITHPTDVCIHFHCFTSSAPFAEKLLQLYPKAFIGFTGVCTFSSTQSVRDVVSITPLDRFLLETDAPYMAPSPYRGYVAHSGMVPFVAKTIAEVKGVSLSDVFQHARQNTKVMYGI